MASQAQPLTPVRPISKPRRIDLRLVLGVLLLLIGIGGSILFYSSNADTQAVLVATRDLSVGATLREEDLAAARVRLDGSLYTAAIPASQLAEIINKPVGAPVYAQQVLVRAQLADPPRLATGQVAMTIAVKAEAAVGGKLKPQDLVQVLVTTDKGKPGSQTELVLDGVAIYSVGYDERLSAAGGGATASERSNGAITSVTLVLTPAQAVLLARAKHNGELDIALLPQREPARER